MSQLLYRIIFKKYTQIRESSFRVPSCKFVAIFLYHSCYKVHTTHKTCIFLNFNAFIISSFWFRLVLYSRVGHTRYNRFLVIISIYVLHSKYLLSNVFATDTYLKKCKPTRLTPAVFRHFQLVKPLCNTFFKKPPMMSRLIHQKNG